MRDLDQQFRRLDELDMPDVRADIWRRGHAPAPAIPGPRAGSRIVAAVVALAIVAAAAAIAVREVRDESAQTPTPSPVGSVWADLPEGFSSLPAPPITGQGMVRAWGGGTFLIWGGQAGDGKPVRDDGAVFDAATLAWAPTAPSPLSARAWPGAVWTGTEFVIWGGSDGDWPGGQHLDGGAAYDPASDTWRRIAAAPVDANAPLTTTWTGSEMIVWGSVTGDAQGTGAAYDPAADTWRVLPDAPAAFTDAQSVWTGQEVVVFGARRAGYRFETPATGVAYDPVSNRWRTLPDSELSPNANGIVWDGTRLVAMDYLLRVQTLDEGAGRWVDLPRLPTNACEGFPQPAVDRGLIVTEFCGELVSLPQGATRWHVLQGRGEVEAIPIAYAQPFAVDGAFLLMGSGGYPDPSPWAVAYQPAAQPTQAREAWDVAAAFGALRSHYPYDADNVPRQVQAEMDSLLTPSAASQYEERSASGLRRLWAYYYGFEVISVEGGAAPYTAAVRFTADESFKERLTIGPGVAVDGVQRDFVVLSAEPIE